MYIGSSFPVGPEESGLFPGRLLDASDYYLVMHNAWRFPWALR